MISKRFRISVYICTQTQKLTFNLQSNPNLTEENFFYTNKREIEFFFSLGTNYIAYHVVSFIIDVCVLLFFHPAKYIHITYTNILIRIMGLLYKVP